MKSIMFNELHERARVISQDVAQMQYEVRNLTRVMKDDMSMKASHAEHPPPTTWLPDCLRRSARPTIWPRRSTRSCRRS